MQRCAWATKPLLVDYHDHEWNQPVPDSRHWFEHLCLAVLGNTLPVWMILGKREAFRLAFHNFDPAYLAACSEPELAFWLQDARLIRNRAKLSACLANAQTWLALQQDLGGTDEALWEWLSAGPADSQALAASKRKALLARGFQRLGPLTVHDWLLAIGVRPGHQPICALAAANR